MSIRIEEPGLSTTVQDTGRYGHYHIGMPPAGAMDEFSHRVANVLVGNPEDAATLEMTYQGPDLEFEEDAIIAITGADMSPELDGEDIPLWEVVSVDANQTLSVNFATEGARSYLAIAGGIDVPTIMDSRATYTLIGLGGYEGRELETSDVLSVGDLGDEAGTAGNAVESNHRPDYADESQIRVVMGLCDYRLTDESREMFLNADWSVSPEADRVGYRFKGADIEFVEREQPFGAGADPSNVVDVGYPVGSIQVPEQPIVLMRDAVTGGGYATVGTVISPDRDLLAQRPTHGTVNFESVTIEEALEAREARRQNLDTIRDSLD